jgi:hypothetical protein
MTTDIRRGAPLRLSTAEPLAEGVVDTRRLARLILALVDAGGQAAGYGLWWDVRWPDGRHERIGTDAELLAALDAARPVQLELWAPRRRAA